MANIDSVFGRIFTDPKAPDNQVIHFNLSLFLFYEILFSNHLFIQMNHFISLISVLVPVVLVNIFYGENNGVQKVYSIIYSFFLNLIIAFCQGFGFTLRGNSDFALHKFLAGAPETFDPYYGVKDIDGDGDIFKSENIDALQNYVNKCTMNNGVHIVMADGVWF
jgi:hypothetical protein